MKQVRNEMTKLRKVIETNHKEKIEHLTNKYREDLKSKLREVPKGLERYRDLSIFKESRQEETKTPEPNIEVTVVGDIELDVAAVHS